MLLDKELKLPIIGVRLSLRFILPIALVLGLLALVVVPLVDTLNMRWSIRDLNLRAQLVADTLQEPLVDLLERNNRSRLHMLFDHAVQDERLYALAFCDTNAVLVERTLTYPSALGCTPQLNDKGISTVRSTRTNGLLHVTVRSIKADGKEIGSLIMAHDMSFIEHRANETRSYVIAIFFILGIMVTAITVLVANMSWRNWMRGVRSMLNDDGPDRDGKKPTPEVQPLLGDVRKFLGDIARKRNLRDHLTMQWKPETLRQLLRDQLYGDEIIVVSNREPYIHTRSPKGIEVLRPASGLVTAVEPVMRACSGTWIAHGVGSADRESVDKNDRVQVPPLDPSYTLRRIWLSEEEERGYYYGFANEGLWPLCHIAHVRPSFRAADWDQYLHVNQRFADAVVAEADTRDPVVLVQDYHFALLPKMIRERLPRATVLTFWHIPWPNPESFGICPWRNEILEGLLGSTILGFHTAYHCKNFIETVDRFLETRVERETSTISYRGKLTMVQDYPISIAWPDAPPPTAPTFAEMRQAMRQRLGISDDQQLALGVDRLDYTKGIIERFEAVERMLEKNPAWVGRFVLIQIAAPSRSLLLDYQNFETKVRESALRINKRFETSDYQPIRLLVEQHSSASVVEHYRACDVCVVTSLHDGMNLVAKEFIAAREDEAGVLILSQFAGAAGELREALVVNPYDLEETAAALQIALTMPLAEQRERMRSMRSLVRDFNIYRWAGRMLLDGAAVRQRARVNERIFKYRSRYSGTLQ
jgi:trehalose-6-phosphate synthase